MLPNFNRVPVPATLDGVLAFLRLLQDNLNDIFKRIVQQPILDGRLLTGIALAANTATPCTPNLGRAVSGWFVTDINAATSVFRVPSVIGGQLVLQAPVACTVSVWVF